MREACQLYPEYASGSMYSVCRKDIPNGVTGWCVRRPRGYPRTGGSVGGKGQQQRWQPDYSGTRLKTSQCTEVPSWCGQHGI